MDDSQRGRDGVEVLEVFESWKTGSAVFISLLATTQIP